MDHSAAFERAYGEYKREIYSFAYSLMRTEHEATELMQETFLAFYEELKKEQMPESRERPWLYRVTKNKCLNALRARKDKLPAEEAQLRDSRTPEGQLSQKQEVQAVHEVMAALRERDAMLLRLYSLGLSYAEIAETMGFERSSVGKLLDRAKQAFRTRYQKHPRST